MQTRNPVLVVVFSFLTLGFYGLYWIATTQNALNRKTGMGASGVTHTLDGDIWYLWYLLVLPTR